MLRNLALLTAFAFVGGCSSASDDDATNCISEERDGVAYSPVSHRDGLICAPRGFPFTQIASANVIGDATVEMDQPRTGALCLTGAASTSGFGFGALSLGFSIRNADATEVLAALDAESIGITQMEFTISASSTPDISVELGTVTSFSCPESPSGCSRVPAFGLMTGPGAPTPLSITAPGRIRAPFANFEQMTPEAGRFDPTRLDHLAFVAAGAYDFCVSDFVFLDRDDRAVQP